MFGLKRRRKVEEAHDKELKHIEQVNKRVDNLEKRVDNLADNVRLIQRKAI